DPWIKAARCYACGAESRFTHVMARDFFDPSPEEQKVRHPPQSGWLDELGRLKGGWCLSLGVAQSAPWLIVLELTACSIRAFLLADVFADLFQFEADSGNSVTPSPEMLPRKVSLLAAQSGDSDRTL